MRELSHGTNAMAGERPSPAAEHTEAELTDAERKHAGGLMRINHTGEVCAQALYRGQALVAKTEETRTALLEACLLYTSPSPRDLSTSRMPSSA